MKGVASYLLHNRFGLGCRHDGGASDIVPAAWAELALADPPADGLRASHEHQRHVWSIDRDKSDGQQERNRANRDAYRAELRYRIEASLAAPVGFRERLVHFWSDHFTVSARNVRLRGIVGAYEREAIRPHVTGRFADMLQAAALHPAMLIFLDNIGSVGAMSQVGQRRDSGLNENLAREILELHTLGAGNGYDQADITELARVLTGWTVHGERADAADQGRVRFLAAAHDGSARTVAGIDVSRHSGAAQARHVFDALARHPRTAMHIGFKLAAHFTSERPPRALVERLARTFLEHDGHLPHLYKVLLEAPEVHEHPSWRYRSPLEHVTAMARAVPPQTRDRQFWQLIARSALNLGQAPWTANSPAGWPVEDTAWLASGALQKRLELAETLAAQLPQTVDPRQLLETVLPGASVETRFAIAGAGTRQQGIALAFMAPEFLKR